MTSFAKDSLASFAYSISSLLIGILSSIIIARILGPAGKGELAILLLVPAVLLKFGNLGLGSSIIYYLGQKKYELREVAGNMLSFALGGGLSLIILFFLIYHITRTSIFVNVNPLWLLLLILTIPLQLMIFYIQKVLIGIKKIVPYSFLSILNLFLGFGLVLTLLFRFKLGVFGVILAAIIGNIIFCAILVFYLNKISDLSFNINPELLKKFLTFGVIGQIGTVAAYLTYRSDMFMINYYKEYTSVGIYSLGVGMAELMLLFSGSIALVLYPQISSMKNDEEGSYVPLVLRNVLFWMVMGSIFLAILGRPLILYFYGKDFLPAYGPFLILLPGVIFLSGAEILSAYTTGRGKPQIAAWTSVSGLFLNITLNLIFIPWWGINGAAFTSTLAYGVFFLILLFVYIKMSKEDLFEALFIRTEDIPFYLALGGKVKNRVISYFARECSSAGGSDGNAAR